jgi:PAS domain S-box-containing protein
MNFTSTENFIFLNRIIKALPIAIIITDSNQKMLAVNKELLNLFGYNKNEVMGEHINLFLPSELKNRHLWQIKKFEDKSDIYKMNSGRQTYGRHKSGELINIDISLSSIKIENEQLTFAIILDKTKINSNELLIKTQYNKLLKLAWYNSHKIRHETSNIRGLVNLLKNKDTDSELYMDYVEKSLDKLEEQIKEINVIISANQ